MGRRGSPKPRRPFSRTKYGNVRTKVDGVWFDSKKEARRWQELKLLRIAREISDLRAHVPYPIEVNGIHITTYVADFVYFERGRTVIEDVKGWDGKKFLTTPEFDIKWRLAKALWGDAAEFRLV